MTRNIDDLADSGHGREPPGEKLKETFLQSQPKSQWPPYIDETAKDVVSNVAIGDTELDKYNFPREVGPLYYNGLIATTEGYSDIPDTLTEIDESDLGRAVLLINRLERQINQSDTGLENTQRAVTAVLEKILSDTAESSVTPHLSNESNSTADILIQMLSDPDVASRVEKVLDEFEDAYHSGLLAKLDKPQMMTPLWEHQRDALERWLREDSRGYVDMATATGKTVLGLAAIASHYGDLHPFDSDIEHPTAASESEAEVLIVAHNDLILEQWRRELDRHLNIPEERTQVKDDIELLWGNVHFRTAQTLLNQELIEYDLVILDEAHHYASGSGWGQLLDEFDKNVLALSGSVDTDEAESSTIRERLETKIGTECKRYTLAQAQQDGIIPTFGWTIEYTEAAGDDTEFAEITEKAEAEFEKFKNRVQHGRIDIETDRRLRTFQDIRRFSHTTEGKALKQDDDQFRDLVTTLFSRRTQRWNQSPDIEAVKDVVTRFIDQKVVVLTDNNAQVQAVAEQLRNNQSVSNNSNVYTVSKTQSSQEQRDTVDEFDEPTEQAILVGTGDLLGEGVDMQHAEVGVNMATGSVNKQLIQRVGRVLRNPGTDKRARFVNLVGVPTERNVQIPVEDGQSLVENARKFKQFGDSFDNDPVFTAGEKTDPTGIKRLLDGGYKRITTLDEEGLYKWPDSKEQRETLNQLLTAISSEPNTKTVLSSWSPDGQDANRAEDSTRPDEMSIKIIDGDSSPIENAFISISGKTTATYGRTDDGGEVRFFDVQEECVVSIHTPDGGIRTVDVNVENGQATDLTINVKSALNP